MKKKEDIPKDELKKTLMKKNQLMLDLNKEIDLYQQQLMEKDGHIDEKNKELEVMQATVEMLKQYITHLNQEFNEAEERNKELVLKKIFNKKK